MQNIGEGVLDIPKEWHNHSVNIFAAKNPGTPGLSITINRDRLPFQTTVDEYVQTQCDKLVKQLKEFQLIERTDVEVAEQVATQLEFTWQTDDAGPIHQVLLCIAAGDAVLNFAASFPGRMSDKQLAEAKRLLHSFRFNPPELLAESGAEHA